MKTKKHSNMIASITGTAAAIAMILVALAGMVVNGASIQMNWLPLAGLVLGSAAVCGLIAMFFNSIDR